MPKISLPDSIVNTEGFIETLINEIEYLLEGKLDTDNLFRDGTTVVNIPRKKVIDAADDTRPIVGDKFFGWNPDDSDDDGDYTFRDRIFDPLINNMKANKRFIVLEAKEPFILNDTPEDVEKKEINGWEKFKATTNAGWDGAKNAITSAAAPVTSIFNQNAVKKKKTKLQEQQEELAKKKSEETSIYNRKIVVKKPPNFKLVTVEEMKRFFPNETQLNRLTTTDLFYSTYIDVRSNLTSSDPAPKILVDFSHEDFDEVVFNATVKFDGALDSTQYINVDILIIALFEDLP